MAIFRKRRILGVLASPSTNIIPLSFSDPRFSGNTAGTNGAVFTTGSQVNKTWNDNPTYPNGTPSFSWDGTSGNIFNMSKCNIDWREGARITASGGTANFDQIFTNCIGFTGDHADGSQAFGASGSCTVNWTNSCFRAYDSTEAIALYGSTAVGSDCIFWADTSGGTITFNNVVFWGGDRGCAIYADATQTVHVNFNNVYFVKSTANSFNGFKYDIRATGGTLVVDNWTNVFDATIVGNTIIPGAALPHP